MKKTVKTIDVFNVYQIIGNAKLGKMEDADKLKIWKLARALKDVAVKYDEDRKDAADKMKPSEDFDVKMQKVQEYELAWRDANSDKSKYISTDEYIALRRDYRAYDALVGKAIADLGAVTVDIDIEPLTEEACLALQAGNDWTMWQVVAVGEVCCE